MRHADARFPAQWEPGVIARPEKTLSDFHERLRNLCACESATRVRIEHNEGGISVSREHSHRLDRSPPLARSVIEHSSLGASEGELRYPTSREKRARCGAPHDSW